MLFIGKGDREPSPVSFRKTVDIMHKYDAFISYNHNPRDFVVTKNLQRKLENYRLPKGTKTSTGKTRIERVFLDTGELEVAGDLSEILYDALDNADNLIVICSPESKASIWVRREIEYFLSSHSADQVHTVITDGEPIDVLPDLLLSEEIEDENGNIISKSREPLSCDYRMPLRQANRQELPRLVAAIVGCRYDDLVQRQKQYRRKRMTAVLAAVAVFMVSLVSFLLWSNHQVRKSLEASLIAQSRSLAIQSSKALNEGDRIGAVMYALDALPSKGNDRPVVPDAVLALSEAMNYYNASSEKAQTAVRRYPSYGSRHLRIKAVSVDSGMYFAELYNNGRAVLWNADTGQELMAKYMQRLLENGISVQNLAFNEYGQLYLVTKNSIICVEPETEEEIARYDLQGEYYKNYSFRTYKSFCDDLVVSGDTVWLPVETTGRRKQLEGNAEFVSDEDEIYNYYELDPEELSFKIQCISLNEGKVIAEMDAPARPVRMQMSLDLKYLACCYSEFYDFRENKDPDQDLVVIADADDLSIVGSFSKPFVSDIVFNSNNQLIVCGFDSMPDPRDDSADETVDFSGTGKRTLLTFANTHNITLSCFDASSCEEQWSKEYKVHANGKPWLVIGDPGTTVDNVIICTVGNVMLITDDSGKDITTLHPLSEVEENLYLDGEIQSVLNDGEIALWDSETGEMVTGHNMLHGPILDMDVAGDSFFIMSTNTELGASNEIVTQYAGLGIDPAWQNYEYGKDDPGHGEMKFVAAGSYEDSFIEIRREQPEEDENRDGLVTEILVRDSITGKINKRHIVTTTIRNGEDSSGNPEYQEFLFSGIDSDRGKVYFLDNASFFNMTLMSVDLVTGDEEQIPLIISSGETEQEQIIPKQYFVVDPSELYSAYSDMAGIFSVHDGNVYYTVIERIGGFKMTGSDYQFVTCILSVDPETGFSRIQEVRDASDEQIEDLFNNTRINAASSTIVMLKDTGFLSMDFDGDVNWTGEKLNYKPAGFTCADDGTVIALETGYNEARLHIYSAKDGSEVKTVGLGTGNIGSHEKMDWCMLSDDEQLVIAGDDAFLLDSRTWELRSVINDVYITYNPDTKQFMLGNAGEKNTGHVPYRSLDEMITEAQKLL